MIRSEKAGSYIEKLLVITLSGLSITLFLQPYDNRLFMVLSIVSLLALLAWRYIFKFQPPESIPKPLVIVSVMLIVSVAISALMSDNQRLALNVLSQFRFIFIGGLLFTAPLQTRYRKIIIVVFFLSAVVAGGKGIMPIVDNGRIASFDRPLGFSSNAICYSSNLAVVCGASIIMLFMSNKDVFTTKKGFLFLTLAVSFSFCGIMLSQSRGTWIALLSATIITLLLYNRRKAIVLIFSFAFVISVVFLNNAFLKQRATSIFTSIYTENETGSTGNRFELWKAALLIFKDHPFLGCGLTNFQSSVEKLIKTGEIKKPETTIHAHNIYLQALATQGIFGMMLLIAFTVLLLRWGMHRIRYYNGIGGYIIIFTTVLYMVAGLTDNVMWNTMFMAACCLTIGLLGPLGTMENSEKVVVRNDER